MTKRQKWIKTADRLPIIAGPGLSQHRADADGDVVDGVLVYAGGCIYQGYPTGEGDSWMIKGVGLADPPERWMRLPKKPTRLNEAMEPLDGRLERHLHTVQEALRHDEEYRYGWRANIAMCVYDRYCAAMRKKGRPLNQRELHKVANDGAEAFIDLLTK